MTGLPAGTAWLFCPADRPERFAKAAALADVVILDLEDGVSASARPAARRALAEAGDQLDPDRTVVRINPVGTPDHDDDLIAVRALPFTTVMLAKTESAAQLESLSGLRAIALCETARGIQAVERITAGEACAGVMWGAEDLIVSLGGSSSRHPDGRYRDIVTHARVSVLTAAAAAGIPALDSVYLDIADLDGLRLEAMDAAESGFSAKVCIHPGQLAAVRAGFAPTSEQVAWAERIIAAAASPDAHGVFALDGRMIDEPLLRQARRTLARAG